MTESEGCYTALVDGCIGTAYRVVKAVHAKLAEITYLAENLGVMVPAALARVTSAGTLAAGHAVDSVTKVTTGTYLVNLSATLVTTTPGYALTKIGAAGFATVIAETTTSVTVETRDSSGSLADSAFSLTVWSAEFGG